MNVPSVSWLCGVWPSDFRDEFSCGCYLFDTYMYVTCTYMYIVKANVQNLLLKSPFPPSLKFLLLGLFLRR